MTDVPEGYRYTETHEWVKAEGGRAKVGLTKHAVEELTDIVYVELPEVGLEVKKGDALGVVESVKASEEFYAPVSGKVVAVNEAVVDEPERMNAEPYDAWLVEIEMSDPSELDSLLSPSEYASRIG